MKGTIKMRKIKKNSTNGITLISLVITIIVLLILAGVSIAMLTGDNGILTQATEAKEKTEISTEKEQIELSLVASLSKNGEILEKDFQKNLDASFGKNIAVLYRDDQDYIIKINNIRVYRYNSTEKKVLEENMDIFIEDETPGQFDGLGDEEIPYIIMSIEDLLYFSQSVNNGITYEGKTIKLGKDLNFKSDLSYCNPNSKNYGDLNNDGIIDTIKNELIITDNKCSGFPSIANSENKFMGIFDGNLNKINNIYQNTSNTKGTGLFKNNYGEIKNLCLSGNIISNGDIGAIAYKNEGIIFNCHNYVDITCTQNKAHYASGGICALNNKTIDSCTNYGTIVSYSNSGGIVGTSEVEGSLIKNSCNFGEIKAIGDERSYNN